MSKRKDENEFTTVILRNFSCEFAKSLRSYTGEKTNTKAVELVCARYLGLEKLADDQKHQINDLDNVIDSIVLSLRSRRQADKNINKFLKDMDLRI